MCLLWAPPVASVQVARGARGAPARGGLSHQGRALGQPKRRALALDILRFSVGLSKPISANPTTEAFHQFQASNKKLFLDKILKLYCVKELSQTFGIRTGVYWAMRRQVGPWLNVSRLGPMPSMSVFSPYPGYHTPQTGKTVP